MVMGRKNRDSKALLSKAGFGSRSGKGSHTVWSHPLLAYSITLSGKDGSDADHYQERDVRNALRDLEAILRKLEEEEEE